MKNLVRILSLALVVLTLGAALVSCGGPSADPAKAAEALEAADYLVTTTDSKIGVAAAEEIYDIDNLDCIVNAIAKDNVIKIFYFEDAASAKDAYNEMEDDIDEILENIEEKEVVAKCSGKMVYFGTKDAVKAAK